VLRAYARYLRQAGIAYSQGYIADDADTSIRPSPRSIFRCSTTARSQACGESRVKKLGELHQAIEEALADVPSLDDDRILRRYVNAVDATLRTNYFQRNADGSRRRCWPSSSIRIWSTACRNRGPFREIFVYGVEVEGVHLRFGKVARGGFAGRTAPRTTAPKCSAW
jgi:glutamate dehydrogenase